MTKALSLKVLRGFRQRNYVTTSTSNVTACMQTIFLKESRKLIPAPISSIEGNKLSQETYNCCWKSRRTFASNAAHARSECPHLSSSSFVEAEVKSNLGEDTDASSSSRTLNDPEWEHALPYEDIPGPKPIPILGNTWR